MTRTLYDSTNLDDLPAAAEMVASYVDGLYAQPAEKWARFAAVPRIRIAVSPDTDDGDAGDCEAQDMDPASVARWVARRRASGHPFPVAYCNRASRPDVEANLTALGLTGAQCGLWIATLDGTQAVDPGPYPVVAIQYAGEAQSGGHFDLSLVPGRWPGVDPEEAHMALRIETPFQARFHAAGAHWAANSDGSGDQGVAELADGSTLTIVEVSSDGNYVRPDLGSLGSSWWLPAATVGVLLGGSATGVPAHTHPVSVTASTGQPS